MKEVVFVCTGNTCRSPMAEGIFKKLYGEEPVKVSSRGLMVFQQQPANEYAVRVMNEAGINITDHVSKPLDVTEHTEQAVLLTMTRHQKEVLQGDFYKGMKVFTIKEVVGETGDVEDPYGGSYETYQSCAGELMNLVKKLGGIVNDWNWQ